MALDQSTHPESLEPARLSVAFTFDGPRCDLWLVGRLDAYSSVALQAQADQFGCEPFEEIVVHADELQALDETGTATLAALRHRIEERGARFRIDGMDARAGAFTGPTPTDAGPRP